VVFIFPYYQLAGYMGLALRISSAVVFLFALIIAVADR
jgi:hypothetical protein